MLEKTSGSFPHPEKVTGEEGTQADDTADNEAESHDDKCQHQGNGKLQRGIVVSTELFTVRKEESRQQEIMEQIYI